MVLASASPRRRELLQSAGIDFVAVPAGGAEIDDASLGCTGLVMANARAKALEVASARPREIVLGADTLVWLDGRPLGKPADLDSARDMLAALSGRIHEVVTGVHVVRLDPLRQIEFHETTRVRFRMLDDAVIGDYLARVDVLDKAGAYALQEHGGMLVESVEGSRSNVVGLPLERTLAALRHFAEGLP
ncbi:MAG: septum formation protein Maf [Chthoniobacterales bacterium]|nr:septum formation protein Maf [Chthoniobacterales bacterium]